jgi:hypothetical protein
MNDMFNGKVEKLLDNFASSPGSGHFGEMGMRKSQMQQQASTLMTTINAILKSVINLLYDLKEFKIRLTHYEDARSSNNYIKEAGILALKQIWMDKVDSLRGIGSINQMSSGQLHFVTLRDAFLKANSLEEVDKIDLNERVIRVLKPRLHEFLIWKKNSEKELKKRFEIEKTYLKSQVDSLKLQSRWAKPYLKAAEQLENSRDLGTNAALVNAFNILLLNLSLMGKRGLDVNDAIIAKELPADFKKMRRLRKYNSIVMIDFNFRGVPSKAGQNYTFGGRSDVSFKSYALNDDEIELLKSKLGESDLNSSLKLIEGMTEDSLNKLKVDLEEFLGEEEEEKKKEPVDVNPFSGLFSFLKFGRKLKSKQDKEERIKLLKEKGIKPDSYAEKYLRNLAEATAMNNCFSVFDIYKKSHGMAAFPYREEEEPRPPRTKAEETFGFDKQYI